MRLESLRPWELLLYFIKPWCICILMRCFYYWFYMFQNPYAPLHIANFRRRFSLPPTHCKNPYFRARLHFVPCARKIFRAHFLCALIIMFPQARFFRVLGAGAQRGLAAEYTSTSYVLHSVTFYFLPDMPFVYCPKNTFCWTRTSTKTSTQWSTRRMINHSGELGASSEHGRTQLWGNCPPPHKVKMLFV